MDRWMTPEKEGALKAMRSNVPNGTRPELLLMAALEITGCGGFERNADDLPGSPDVLYRREGLAVFMHGCFWHSCPTCYPEGPGERRTGGSNSTLWLKKFIRNYERDAMNCISLHSLGYAVFECWECQVNKEDDLLAVCEAVGRLLEYAREA